MARRLSPSHPAAGLDASAGLDICARLPVHPFIPPQLHTQYLSKLRVSPLREILRHLRALAGAPRVNGFLLTTDELQFDGLELRKRRGVLSPCPFSVRHRFRRDSMFCLNAAYMGEHLGVVVSELRDKEFKFAVTFMRRFHAATDIPRDLESWLISIGVPTYGLRVRHREGDLTARVLLSGVAHCCCCLDAVEPGHCAMPPGYQPGVLADMSFAKRDARHFWETAMTKESRLYYTLHDEHDSLTAALLLHICTGFTLSSTGGDRVPHAALHLWEVQVDFYINTGGQCEVRSCKLVIAVQRAALTVTHPLVLHHPLCRHRCTYQLLGSSWLNHDCPISDLPGLISDDGKVEDPLPDLHLYHCTHRLSADEKFVLTYKHWDLRYPTTVFLKSGDGGRRQGQLLEHTATDDAGGSYPLVLSDYFHNNELLDNDGKQVMQRVGTWVSIAPFLTGRHYCTVSPSLACPAVAHHACCRFS